MKSLHLKILLWCFATLLLSLLAFSGVSRFVEARAVGLGGPFARVDAMIFGPSHRSLRIRRCGAVSRRISKKPTTP